jgi:hypothetical protein
MGGVAKRTEGTTKHSFPVAVYKPSVGKCMDVTLGRVQTAPLLQSTTRTCIASSSSDYIAVVVAGSAADSTADGELGGRGSQQLWAFDFHCMAGGVGECRGSAWSCGQ